MATDVTVEERGAGARVRGMVEDLDVFLRQAGALMVSASQEAFALQALGDIRWLQRYPNQEPPLVNVAGLVSDLARGREPKARRFIPRPALEDTGALFGSIAFEVKLPNAVEWGSSQPYAETMQKGGTSVLEIPPEAKELLGKFLGTPFGKPYREKLGFIFHETQLVTEVVERPFLGFTPRLREDLLAAARQFMADGIGGE